MVLAGLVFCMGLGSATLTSRAPMPPVPAQRGPEVTFMQAVEHAREPAWVTWSNPLVGAAGALVGAALARPNRTPANG